MSKPKLKIFLSYAFSNANYALDNFITDLKNTEGITIWTADRELDNGSEFFNLISSAISDCDYFIHIPSFENSKWVNVELQIALAEQLRNQNFKVLTVFLYKMPVNQRILYQAKKEIGTYFYLWDNYETAFKYLIDFISVKSNQSLHKFSLGTLTNGQTIIDISSRVNEKLINYFSKNPEKLKVMDRRLFEELIAELFSSFGYKIELTQKTRDGGRDIIAIKNNEVNLKYLIECKRPDPGNIVGIKPVRELFGVKADEKASKAILATTSFFSNDAKLFFERNKWELEAKDYNGIIQWLEEYKRKKNIA